MASGDKEMAMSMDWDVLDSCGGFSLDVGGSVIKLAYISEEDWIEPKKRKQDSKGTVRLVTFSGKQKNNVIDVIKKKARIARDSSDVAVDVHTTGVSSQWMSVALKDQLNVRNIVLSEFECFVQYLRYSFHNLPRSEAVYPVQNEAKKSAENHLKTTLKILEDLKKMGGDMTLPEVKSQAAAASSTSAAEDRRPLAADDTLYPYILVTCGSAMACSLVAKDGTYSVFDTSPRCGKTFLALSSLFTGAKTFDEVLKLAEKGKANKVNDTNLTMLKSVQSSSKGSKDNPGVYGAILDNNEEMTTFTFGQAEGKTFNDFEEADLVRGLLESMVGEICQLTYYMALNHKVQHVVFCGGFVDSRIARDLLQQEWMKRDIVHTFVDPQKTERTHAHFVKHSQMLGVLGALMNNKLKSTKSPSAPLKQSESKKDVKKPKKTSYSETVGF